MDPPSANVIPGSPDEVSVTWPGLSTARISVFVGSPRLVRVTLGALIVTTCLLVPVTLYLATWLAPLHTRLVVAQLNAPAREIPTVAPDQAPRFKVMVPRSRS